MRRRSRLRFRRFAAAPYGRRDPSGSTLSCRENGSRRMANSAVVASQNFVIQRFPRMVRPHSRTGPIAPPRSRCVLTCRLVDASRSGAARVAPRTAQPCRLVAHPQLVEPLREFRDGCGHAGLCGRVGNVVGLGVRLLTLVRTERGHGQSYGLNYGRASRAGRRDCRSYLPLSIVRAFGSSWSSFRLGLSVRSAFRLWSASLALPTA